MQPKHIFCQRGIRLGRGIQQRYRNLFYGFNHCDLSNRLDHMEARLGCNGYGNKFGGDIFLDAIAYEPVDPMAVDVSFDIKLQWKNGPGAPRGSGNRHVQKSMRH